MAISQFNQECLDRYTYYIESQMNEEYEDYKRENTLKNYTGDVKQFLAYIGDKKCTAAEYKDANEWLLSLKGRGGNKIKPKTRNRKISALNSFYGMLLDFKIDNVERNPFSNILLSKINIRHVEQKEILEKDEIQLLKHELNLEVMYPTVKNNQDTRIAKLNALRNRAIICLMLASGMRVGEICTLETDEISLYKDNKNVAIVYVPREKAKGKRERYIPIDIEVYNYIQLYRKALRNRNENNYVFLSKNGNKMSANRIGEILNEFIDRCGIDKKITNHCLRHTFSSHMLNHPEAKIGSISQILGHKDPKLLMETYAHQTQESMELNVFKF